MEIFLLIQQVRLLLLSCPLSLIQNYAAVQNILGAGQRELFPAQLGKLRLVAIRRFRLLKEVAKIFKFLNQSFARLRCWKKVSQIHKTYLLDQQLFCWRHFFKTEDVQNTDLNILAL